MSQGAKCHVHGKEHYRRDHIRHNHSAFNGYHQTYSPYTEIVCVAPTPSENHPDMTCDHRWRSRADWIDDLPLLKKGEIPRYPEKEACL